MNIVVLSGGSGSRLWPKSREKLPKQLLKLTNEFTMLQNTICRMNTLINKLSKKEECKIYIICNKEHSYIIEKQVDDLKLTHNVTIINEPKGRDSAPAICVASLLGNITDNTIVVPSDHIFNDNEFVNCCINSIPYLEKSIVTFGIKPTKPETGYGYIKIGEEYKTEQFVEKPNYELAKQYFDSGAYLWNGGIFAFKNKNMIDCFKNYASDILDNCVETVKNTNFNNKMIHLSSEPFTTCRAISVDYAIMEPLCKDNNASINGVTIPYNYYWNDIGSFSALYDELKKDDDENVILSESIIVNTDNCYIDSHTLTTTIGVNNLIIVNTDDALLICNKNESQDVKKIVEILKQNNNIAAQYHNKVFRPWGWYKNIEGNDNSGFKVKRIAVYPGKRLSLQSHNHRSEHWVIVNGKAIVQLNSDFIPLEKNQNIFIPVNALHRIENVGNELLEFTETQIGDYLGEDDIIRYEDDFGRI